MIFNLIPLPQGATAECYCGRWAGWVVRAVNEKGRDCWYRYVYLCLRHQREYLASEENRAVIQAWANKKDLHYVCGTVAEHG